jgi:hypothetical protein
MCRGGKSVFKSPDDQIVMLGKLKRSDDLDVLKTKKSYDKVNYLFLVHIIGVEVPGENRKRKKPLFGKIRIRSAKEVVP